MKLSESRLCLDCEEIHREQRCPACGSDAFSFLTRWIGTTAAVPASPSDGTGGVVSAGQPPTPAAVGVYRRLIVGDAVRPKAMRLLRRGAVGLAAVSLVRWSWRYHRKTRALRTDDE